MKRILLAGAALGALTFGAQAADVGTSRYNPITAAPAWQASGDIAIGGGVFTNKWSDSDSKSAFLWTGLARANVFVTPNISVQLDINGDSALSSDDKDASFNVAAHVSYRTPGMLIGGMISHGAWQWWWDQQTTVALEGQTYIGPLQLYGQLGWTGLHDGDGDDTVYAHIEARYFWTPNVMLAGNIGFASVGDWADVTRWGLDLEGKMSKSPLGAFLKYQGAHASYSGSDQTQHSFLAGIKIHFNNNTLQSAAQAGATLVDYNVFTGVNRVRFFD